MTIFTKKIQTVFHAKQLYDLVFDVESYPEFLPWCTGAKIITMHDDCFYAKLNIGYKIFNESYTSKVIFKKDQYIDAQCIDGPFKMLHNRWVFVEKPIGIEVEFYLNFEFNNFIFNAFTKTIYNQLTNVMINSFLTRADELYAK